MERWEALCTTFASAERRLFSASASPAAEDPLSLDTVLSEVRSFLSPPHMEQVWRQILQIKLKEDAGIGRVTSNSRSGSWSSSSTGDIRAGADAQGLAFMLLSGHRVLANYLAISSSSWKGLRSAEDAQKREEQEEEFSQRGFHRAVLLPLLTALSGMLQPQEEQRGSTEPTDALRAGDSSSARTCSAAESASRLVAAFPADAKSSLLGALSGSLTPSAGAAGSTARLAVQSLSPPLCLQLSVLLQRLARTGGAPEHPPDAEAGRRALLRLLVQRAVAPPTESLQASQAQQDQAQLAAIIQVLDALVLHKPRRDLAAVEVVACLPGSVNELFHAADHVACLWAERAFIRRPNASAHEGVTAALLSLLARLEGAIRAVLEVPAGETGDKLCSNMLSRQAPSGTPLILTLSNGVNSYLDCAEVGSRSCGMRVAKRFSSMMGMQSAFADLDAELGGDAERDSSAKLVQLDSPAATARGSSAAPASGNKTEEWGGDGARGGEGEGEGEGGTDTDDDLAPMDLTEPPTSTTVAATVYLRACLDMLRMDPAASGAADKQDAALTHVSRILATQPADGALLAGALTRAIINISNSFNLEFFDERRTAAMQALLCLYPYQAVPVVGEVVRSQDAVLGTRVWSVSQLTQAAHGLSGVPMPAMPAAAPTATAATSSAAVSTTGSSTATATATASSASANGKTVIKRPLRHAMLAREAAQQRNTKRHGGYRNPLLPMLEMFIAPLLAILGTEAEGRGDAGGSGSVRTSLPPAPAGIMLDSADPPRVVGFANTSNTRSPSRKGKAVVVVDDASVGGGAGELDALLVAETLMTLSTVTRCAHNTPMQRRLVELVITLAGQYMSSTYLVVRRAALGAASVAIDAWALQRQEQKQTLRAGAGGIGGSALATLSDLAGRTASRAQVPNALADGELGMQVTALVDACMEGLRSEPDSLSRALKAGLARAVLALDEDEEHGQEEFAM